MKAIFQDRYGPPDEVLSIRDIDIPAIADDEVLVRVRAASVHADIWHVVSGRPYLLRLMGSGLRKPKNPVPGTDLAGHVESVGKDVRRFKAGDAVFGESTKEMQWKNGGAFAEYASVSQETLVFKPDNIDFQQAAAIPTSGIIALLNLRGAGQILPGQSVLINGAGGGVGTIALQLAKAYGAHVTGVDIKEKLELVSSLGADQVIDYTQEDFTQGDKQYDLILDIASNLALSDCKKVLNPEGHYVIIGHDHYGKVGSHTFGSLPHFFENGSMLAI